MTAAAEGLLPAAEEMERAMGGFLGALGAVETEVSGLVRITAPPSVADAFVAPLLPRLLARHPQLRIELEASVAYADLTRREADLAIRVARPRSGELVVQKLVETRVLPMASPSYLRDLGGALTRFDAARWIAWGSELQHIPSARWLAQNVEPADVALRSSNFASQLAAAAAGLGIVLAPEPYRHVTELVPVRPGRKLGKAFAALPVEALWLVGHQALRNVPRVSAAWEFLRDHMSRPEAIAELLPNARRC